MMVLGLRSGLCAHTNMGWAGEELQHLRVLVLVDQQPIVDGSSAVYGPEHDAVRGVGVQRNVEKAISASTSTGRG